MANSHCLPAHGVILAKQHHPVAAFGRRIKEIIFGVSLLALVPLCVLVLLLIELKTKGRLSAYLDRANSITDDL